MKSITIMLAVVTLSLMASNLAHAQYEASREGRWEISLQTRYVTSSDFSGEGGSEVSIEDDLGWGFGFGYNINNHFNLSLSFTWRSVPYVATIVDAEDPENTTKYSNWLSTWTTAVSGEYTILRSRISPYVSGSLGWMAINSNIYAGSDYFCWWDPWFGYICTGYDYTYGTDAATWALGAGVRVELTRAAFLRVGYEHGWIDSRTLDGKDIFRVDIGLFI